MRSGLRQMIIGRYSFGVIGIYAPIVLNCIACIGWTTINQVCPVEAADQSGDPAADHLRILIDRWIPSAQRRGTRLELEPTAHLGRCSNHLDHDYAHRLLWLPLRAPL